MAGTRTPEVRRLPAAHQGTLPATTFRHIQNLGEVLFDYTNKGIGLSNLGFPIRSFQAVGTGGTFIQPFQFSSLGIAAEPTGVLFLKYNRIDGTTPGPVLPPSLGWDVQGTLLRIHAGSSPASTLFEVTFMVIV